MRLTLRTMLAYLDDILEPDDTEDIGKKIDESEFATNLVHRTRDCMRRLRLGVPALMGRGLANDPNSVAEYLDNTLSSEKVGEFEKICLESDVHLAEVASCHQILTLVLGEPAEIDPEARHRMYHLASQIDAPPVQTDALRPAGAQAAAALMTPTVVRRPKPEVPEYLREPRSRFLPLFAMVLVAAILTFGGLLVLGPAELRQRAIAFLQGGAEEVAPNPVDGTEPLAAGQVPAAQASTPATDAPASEPTEPAAAGAAEQGAPSASEPPVAAEVSGAERNPSAVDRPPSDSAVEETVPAEDAAATPEPAATVAAKLPDVVPLPVVDSNPAARATPTPPADDVADMPAEKAEAAVPDASSAERAAPAEAVVETYGRYTSKRDMLLKFDVETSNWNRLASMATLSKGDRLLSLPLFRPVITTSTSITIQAEGPSQLELTGFTDEGTPILTVEYGRLLMATVGRPSNSLLLEVGDHQVQLTFADADANLALDVRRILPPGKDPEAGPAPFAVDLYATSGTIRVRDGDKQFDVQAPAHRALVSTGTSPTADGEFPRWVNSESLTDAERQATTAIEPLITAGEPAIVTLKELTDSQHSIGRRREVRALATRSLTYLGDFDPCVAALNDPKEKLSWNACMEELRLAVARSPETAAEVRATFVKQRAADATFLFRTLWGYSTNDLKTGAAKDLIDAMDKDSVDYRVMSFLTLQNITGAPHHGYRPEDPANKRRTPYNYWKDKLRQGKIVPQAAGSTKGKASKGA